MKTTGLHKCQARNMVAAGLANMLARHDTYTLRRDGDLAFADSGKTSWFYEKNSENWRVL